MIKKKKAKIIKKKKAKMVKKKKFLNKLHNEFVPHNWGGHMPNPPENCERKHLAFVHKEVTWIDLSVCHKCSILSECTRRKEYLKALKNN